MTEKQQFEHIAHELARSGSQLVADSLDTEVMKIDSSVMTHCCFAIIRLPFIFRIQGFVLDTNLPQPIDLKMLVHFGNDSIWQR